MPASTPLEVQVASSHSTEQAATLYPVILIYPWRGETSCSITGAAPVPSDLRRQGRKARWLSTSVSTRLICPC